MTRKFNTAIAFGLYGIGLVSFLIADVVVSEGNNESYIAEWAFNKSLILMIGSASLLGYDQLFVRDPSLISRARIRIAIQALIIVAAVVLVVWNVRSMRPIDAFILFLSTLLFSILNFFASAHRAQSDFWKSQMASNIWKLFLLVGLYFCASDSGILFLIALGSATIALLLLGAPKYVGTSETWERLTTDDAVKLGRIFFFSNLTLLVASHGEQLIINLSGDSNASAFLFSHFAVFAPMALGLNGFLGFILGPKIRKISNFGKNDFLKLTRQMTLYSIVTTVISILCGYFYISFFSERNISEFSPLLVGIIALIGIVRGIYVATSVCVGVHGDKKALGVLARQFWFTTGFYLILASIVVHFFSGIVAAQLMAIAALLNWTLRWFLSHSKSLDVLQRMSTNS